MKILNLYVGKSLLTVFTASIAVMTFIMISGFFVKDLSLVSELGMGVITKVILLRMPEALSFSMPIALLVATTLVFSRMSAENEITAMRASGISLWQITAPGLIMSIIISALSFYFQLYLGPISKQKMKDLVKNVGLKDPTALISPGSTVKFQNQVIKVGQRDGDELSEITIKVFDNERLATSIDARSGRFVVDKKNQRFDLELFDAITSNYTYQEDGRQKDVLHLTAQKQIITYDAKFELNKAILSSKDKHLNLDDSLARIQLLREQGQEKRASRLLFLINKKMAIALSPFAFILMGMPFGFRSSRAETSFGLVISLFLLIGYFAIIFLCEAFEKKTSLHPEILVWLPNILYQVTGIWLLRKVAS